MSVYGYCRISTAKQSIERQIRNIREAYPEAHIVQEAFTGTSTNRPEWNKLYRILKEGDTVIFDSVSRMSRNAEEGYAERVHPQDHGHHAGEVTGKVWEGHVPLPWSIIFLNYNG